MRAPFPAAATLVAAAAVALPGPVLAAGIQSAPAPASSAAPAAGIGANPPPDTTDWDSRPIPQWDAEGRPLSAPPTDSTVAASPASSGQPLYGPRLAGVVRAADAGGDLVEGYRAGLRNDATFRAALAERDANRQLADQTIAGYLPSANYNYANIPTESGARHVVTVTQPVLSLSGLATLRQRGPRRRFADATLEVRSQDLAVRLLTAVVDIVRAREAAVLNEARIDAFSAQSKRADLLYKRGLGTVTDARDIEVRYEQALANRVLLEAELAGAQERLRSITGVEARDNGFALPERFGPIDLDPLASYFAAQEAENPQIAVARENERISKLESDRIRGSLLPTVGVSATYTRRNNIGDSFVGLSLNAPLAAGSFFQTGAAKATARRAMEERRQVQERARTELSRLHSLVNGGRRALDISSKAVDAAELSVTANTRSYEGGVRTSVDVVNAIQTQFEVQNTHVQAATKLALDYLNLLLLAGVPPENALEEVQHFLLAR